MLAPLSLVTTLPRILTEPDDLRDELAAVVEDHLGAGVGIEDLEPLVGGASRELWSFDLVAGDERRACVLRRDPEGVVVVLHAVYPQVDELLARRWRRVMPDVAERILFLPRQDQLQFNNLLMLCDVLLDPFPYGGGMSSLEAFSFGVPVITLPSHFLSGRFTQAFYRRLGIEACIARDVEDYIQIAVRLASDAELNRQVREQIVAGQGGLFEVEGAVRDWERFLKSVVAK